MHTAFCCLQLTHRFTFFSPPFSPFFFLLLLTLIPLTHADATFARPTLSDRLPPRNVTGGYAGVWSSIHTSNLTDEWTRFWQVEGYSLLPTPPPSQHWQTPHPAKRVAELRLTSSLEPGEAQLLQGTLILKDSTTQDGPEVGETEGGRIGKRRYIVRAVVSEDNHRLAIFAAPQGLKHLILKDFLYEDRIFHAYIDASYHIAQYFGATLALIGAESYAMPENISRKSSLPSDSIEKDPCLFFGDLKVSGGEEGFGVDGVLISLTCNMSVNVSVGQGVVVGETVWMQNYLLGAGVVTGVQGWGFVRQGVHTPSAVAHARLAWLSFFNLGVLEWAMFGSHFSLLTPMPALLRCVLGIGMLHGLILKLCTQHVMNALLANSFFSDLFSRCWVLAANVAWWAVVYRVPYLWIPAMFLLHSIWLPQIYHSACVNASKPVAPLLLVTTFAARLYYVGAELLHDSFLNTFTPCPGVFVALCVWLLLQTATMLLQHRYGPTFFLPDTWVPPRLASHDYHKLPPQTDDTAAEEAGTSPFHALGGDARRRGGTDATDEEAAAEVECVICQTSVDTGSPKGYMVPPCGHIFHTPCLLEWMNQRMECPICRRELPDPSRAA